MRPALLALAILALLPLGSAGYSCVHDVEGEIAIGGFYIWNNMCQPECIFDLWIFEETNGIEGLQADSFQHNVPCYPRWVEADRIIL